MRASLLLLVVAFVACRGDSDSRPSSVTKPGSSTTASGANGSGANGATATGRRIEWCRSRRGSVGGTRANPDDPPSLADPRELADSAVRRSSRRTSIASRSPAGSRTSSARVTSASRSPRCPTSSTSRSGRPGSRSSRRRPTTTASRCPRSRVPRSPTSSARRCGLAIARSSVVGSCARRERPAERGADLADRALRGQDRRARPRDPAHGRVARHPDRRPRDSRVPAGPPPRADGRPHAARHARSHAGSRDARARVDRGPDRVLRRNRRRARIRRAHAQAAPRRRAHGAEIDKLDEKLVYARNDDWIPKLEKLFATGGVFVAVGADHLSGPRGVIALLAARGFKVTRVTK